MIAARRRALAGALVAVVSGCSLAPVEVEARHALLDSLPSDIPVSTPLAATLLVLETDASPAYDTRGMVYSVAPHELAYFARTEWSDKPARMLNALLVRTIEGMRRFRAVAAPPYAAPVDFTLATELVELRQDFTATPPVERLALRAELRDAQGRSIAATQFEAREPVAERSPQAGAMAANKGAARVLRDLARFVADNTR